MRLRPVMEREGKFEDDGSVRIDAENGCIKIDKQPNFVFNDIFGPAVQQSTVFKQIGLPLVDGLFEGNNVCMFAFGQTGSGKTYSMLGVKGGHGKSFDGPQVYILACVHFTLCIATHHMHIHTELFIMTVIRAICMHCHKIFVRTTQASFHKRPKRCSLASPNESMLPDRSTTQEHVFKIGLHIYIYTRINTHLYI